MKSRWDQAAAEAAVARYGAEGVGEDLALRTYSARLLGGDPSLVLHGGGNTSVKTTAHDLFGEPVDVICVKGSGWDLGAIEPPGHPAVRLEPLRRLRALQRLSDEDMVNAQRQNLLDSAAPNPSVETLLHAFMPAKFIDHTHSVDVLAIADQPDAADLAAEVWGGKVALVPYVMPGFALAKLAAEVLEAHPGVEGLVLLKHGVFSFGQTARESYERMIALVTAAEDYLARKARPAAPAAAPRDALLPAAEALPRLRGALAKVAGARWPARWIADLRTGDAARAVADDPRLGDWATRGVATPDHVIRTKRHPLVLPAPTMDAAAWGEAAADAAAVYVSAYEAYFARNNAAVGGIKTQLDPLPRVAVIPGLGLVGLGKTAAEAAVTADVAENWAATLLKAESVGRFEPVDEAETFEMEYWSLEQAKLGKAAEKRLERRVVLVTGGAGAIGAATAAAFAAEGADVAVLDLDDAAARATAARVGKRALGLGCDVTDPHAVRAAFDAVCARFGGVDIVVSNAGAATTGMMARMADETLRASFDLNFFAHQAVAQAAVRVMQAQGFGGTLLFNVSKQALNPGPDFGAYGTSKAALMALMRQYALEHGADGIRVNALNPDRIRSGLLTDGMIASRAGSRGVSEAEYMAGNLLHAEVTAQDVAQAFVFTALMTKTTGAVITVDGGNVAAMVR
ncbi:bifunctional aldolase/short-chain dehydrogenase [Caulobacter sp. KR2-114]|uniref:bifunctional aldolase/short-chain dehydrogenase n=1 Tax=Caulobacter sp. KR2-114 TaxID=3400912 RepID=UPI003C00BD1F